ncbi:MAG: flagellar hook-basal body complex protein FliE [Pseudomonadota bacterium]
MSNTISTLIQADLASLTNAADSLAQATVAPAAQFGGQSQPAFSFAQTMHDAVGKVNDDDRLAAQRMADVDAGKSDDLVGAMLSSQEASLSFSMLMQVRNKVMGAVDELIKLPL